MKDNFTKAKILVIGDIMVDKYIIGKTLGISYEAPIPKVEISKVVRKMGGAGLVIENLSLLRANVSFLGIIGDDDEGNWVKQKIKKMKIKSELITLKKDTPTRNRVITENHNVARFDSAPIILNKTLEEKISKKILKMMDDVNCIVILDYGMGIHGTYLVKLLEKLDPKIPIVVSSNENFQQYKGKSIINKIKAQDILKIPELKEKKSDKQICGKLNKILQNDKMIVTKGKEGLISYEDGNINYIAATNHKMRDPTSAGEILLTAFAASYSIGNSFEDSCIMGNVAAGIAVEKIGIKNIDKRELMSEFKKYNELEFEK